MALSKEAAVFGSCSKYLFVTVMTACIRSLSIKLANTDIGRACCSLTGVNLTHESNIKNLNLRRCCGAGLDEGKSTT